MISLEELTPNPYTVDYSFKGVPRGRLDLTPLSFIFIQPGEPLDAPARLLIARYDRDQDGRLNRAEIGFDAATFQMIDMNRDGQLEESELAARLIQSADAALWVHLRAKPAPQAVYGL